MHGVIHESQTGVPTDECRHEGMQEADSRRGRADSDRMQWSEVRDAAEGRGPEWAEGRAPEGMLVWRVAEQVSG